MGGPSDRNWGGHEADRFYCGHDDGEPILDPVTAYNYAAESYDTWKWQKLWNKVEWPYIHSILGEYSFKTDTCLLDIGVGTGSYLGRIVDAFPIFRTCGIDISERMIEIAGQKLARRPGKNVELKWGDARKLYFEDSYFDIVMICRVGSHLPDLSGVVAEVSRVLRKGGIVLICDIHPLHHYARTRIPCVSGKKLSIQTYKHPLDDWTRACNSYCLQVRRTNQILSSYIRETIREDLPSCFSTPGTWPVSFVISAEK